MKYPPVKRVLDFAFALILAAITLPVQLLLMSLIATIDWMPPLFFHERGGVNNKPFKLIKLRTMRPGSHQVTILGKILRRQHLDEWPQLINIIRGEMSFVGPRPLPVIYYERMNKRHQKRGVVIPGMTGWSQVNGGNSLSWYDRFEGDIHYLENQSFALDLSILLRTIIYVFSSKSNQPIKSEEFLGYD